MSISQQEFTNAGRSMLGRAQAGEILTISKIVVGSGVANQASDLWPLIDLITKKLDVTISTKNDDGQGQLLVEGIFRSDAAPAAFDLHEVGVMAHIGTEADRLYSVANAFTDPVDHIDPASPTFYGYKIKLIIDRIPAANLVIQIGPTDAIQGENVGSGTIGPGWFKEAVSNVMRFKRIQAGYNTEVVEDATASYITVGMKVLHQNVDLYVPTTYPNVPPPPPGTQNLFATIQAAHDYLKQFTIPTDKYATIHVWKGTFVSASPIVIDHPNAQQIAIIGQPRDDRGASAVTYVAGGKTVVVPSNTGLTAGQWVWLAETSTANPPPLAYIPYMGGCKVTNVSGTTITLSTLRRDTQPGNYVTQVLGAGRRLSFLPTVLQNNTDTVMQCPNGIRYLQNLCIVGPGAVASTFGLYLTDTSWLADCMIAHCATAVSCSGGNLKLTGECVVCDSSFGIVESDGMTAAYVTIINACDQGILPAGGASLAGYGAGLSTAWLYLIHCGIGMNGAGGKAIGGGIYYSWNNTGINGTMGTMFQLGTNYGCTPQGNGTDLSASGMSYIYNNCHGITPLPQCNPAADVIGNQNSLIHVIA